MMLNDIQALLPGLGLSVQLMLASLALGLPLGLAAGVGLFEGNRPLRFGIMALTEIGRGFPALVTLYLFYFGLPSLGIVMDAFPALVAAFGYTTASYTADIFRSALASVPKAQHEAAAALSLSQWKTFALIVAPQAIRIVIPPVLGFSIIVFQGTALAYSIGLRELVSRAYDQGTLHFDVMHYMAIAAAMYLAVALCFAGIAKIVQRRIEGTLKTNASPGKQTLITAS
jgi:polar amino acid transport system permease protein